jgi:flavin reductase (DIM6/NTAB) family NADH-FMN oxidoreductase RutF
MTIGWASIGYMWRKPVFTALVRPQRHTFEMIKKAGCFTVSVPTKNELKKELLFAGTKSGRDYDKFDCHGLTAVPAQEVDAPIVKECGLHFECRTLLTQDMTPDRMDPELVNGIYAPGDFHTMFFGEIVRCYSTDEE